MAQVWGRPQLRPKPCEHCLEKSTCRNGRQRLYRGSSLSLLGILPDVCDAFGFSLSLLEISQLFHMLSSCFRIACGSILIRVEGLGQPLMPPVLPVP